MTTDISGTFWLVACLHSLYLHHDRAGDAGDALNFSAGTAGASARRLDAVAVLASPPPLACSPRVDGDWPHMLFSLRLRYELIPSWSLSSL